MNPFKKFLSVLLVLTLVLSAFSACGAAPAPEAVPVETTAADEATEPVPAALAAATGRAQLPTGCLR